MSIVNCLMGDTLKKIGGRLNNKEFSYHITLTGIYMAGAGIFILFSSVIFFLIARETSVMFFRDIGEFCIIGGLFLGLAGCIISGIFMWFF